MAVKIQCKSAVKVQYTVGIIQYLSCHAWPVSELPEEDIQNVVVQCR